MNLAIFSGKLNGMKRLFILFVFIGFFSKAQSVTKVANASFDSLEVFLSIQHHDADIYTTVKNSMQSLSGLNYFTYCDNHSVFLVYIDKNTFATKNIFLEKLQKLNPMYADRFLLMGGGFKDLVNFCEPSDANDDKNLKNSFIK